MRAALIAIVTATITTAALATPPYANELMLPTGGVKQSRPTAAIKVPNVARGQFLGLTCAAVERAAADAVRVVMVLANDEPSTGYSGVLATDQTVEGGTVHVRVPDLPDLAQHTVRVRVYVTDGSAVRSCDGGRVRIV